jgi:hypothetical protein
MLEYEWRELEALCDRISDLRHRHSFALRSRNVGLCEGLREDIARAKRQREQLVQHISARLGSVSGHSQSASGGDEAEDPMPAASSADGGEGSQTIVGFPV